LFEAGYVVSIGYPYYPRALILDQVESIRQAIHFLRENQQVQSFLRSGNASAAPQFVVLGHSSGANIAALALLDHDGVSARNTRGGGMRSDSSGGSLADLFVGLAGVYDIEAHFSWEAGRGVEEASFMQPAAGGRSGFRSCSPTSLVLNRLPGLEGRLLPHFPATILLHGSLDHVVPPSSSSRFAEALTEAGVHCEVVFPPVNGVA
jgi:acetyl esterase/lipase